MFPPETTLSRDRVWISSHQNPFGVEADQQVQKVIRHFTSFLKALDQQVNTARGNSLLGKWN